MRRRSSMISTSFVEHTQHEAAEEDEEKEKKDEDEDVDVDGEGEDEGGAEADARVEGAATAGAIEAAEADANETPARFLCNRPLRPARLLLRMTLLM